MAKFFRSMGSGIEEQIAASLGDVVLGKEHWVGSDLGQHVLMVWRRAVKRGVDLIASGVLLCMSLPLFLVVAVTVKVSSKGPVFFRQERVGQGGRCFRIWKFRTMRQDNSEEEHREFIHCLLNEGDEEEEDRIAMLAKYIDYLDKRTTKVGRFLRASSLDELPQLINVFLGEMSLVGPRPHPEYEVKEYKEWYHRRLDVKPGLTGWSKLNLRCTPRNYEESILFDLWYVDHWSLGLDLRIFLMTVPFVLLMKDAR